MGYGDSTYRLDIFDMNRHNIIQEKEKFQYDYNTEYYFSSYTFQEKLNIYIFACNHNSGVAYFSKSRLFSCDFFDNKILIRKFIPCYSTTVVIDVNEKECPAGTVGLYDTIEGKFYTNQGTGEFIAGPDVD